MCGDASLGRRVVGLRPHATDPFVIVERWDASYVVFSGYPRDADRMGTSYTCLRFKVNSGRIDLANIHVEGRLRGMGVAERLVLVAAEAHPGLLMSFSGANGHSRRLARKLADRIPQFGFAVC